MDVDTHSFQADFAGFRGVIKELEHRLGALIMQVGHEHEMEEWNGTADTCSQQSDPHHVEQPDADWD